MSHQAQLPGTERVLGTYTCGHDRTHQIPSEDVFVLKSGGAGFTAVCQCGLPDGATVDELTATPHHLGPHWTLIGGTTIDPAFWLALEEAADAWESEAAADYGSLGGGLSYRQRRAQRRDEVCQQVETADGGGE